MRWEVRRADRDGRVSIDSTRYLAGPAWSGRRLLVGLRAASVEIRDEYGAPIVELPRSWRPDGKTVADPACLIGPLSARPRAWDASPVRARTPQALREAVDLADAAGRRAILDAWHKAATSAAASLAAFLADEAAARDASRRARLLRAARIPAPKDLEKFDWSPVRLPAALTRTDLVSLAFLEARQDLVLAGDVGCGKTHLAAALARQAALAMRPARFATAAGLVMELRRAKAEGRLDKALTSLARFDLLVIDELGYLPIDTEGARRLFQVISQAYETQSLIITTNLPFAAWGTIFGDEHMAAAIIDRLAHHGHHIKPAGTSHQALGALMRASPQ